MTRRTIIYLHSIELSQASWVICEDEEVERTVLRGHLSDLLSADKLNETIVVVPAVDVLLTDLPLPKLNRQRLLQALPFALEEQLIDDVHELHFAVADYQPEGTLPTAIVARKKMDEWIALLKQYEIVPAELCSAVFLLPLIEKSWSATVLPDAATVRQNTWQGFSGEHANLSVLIDLAVQTALVKPECIHVYNTFSTPLHLQSDSILLNEIHLSELDWLETLPAWVNSATSINLLQGAYQPKRKSSESRKIWAYALYATLACVFLSFFSQIISFFILHHESKKIEAGINRIYKNNFPQASSVVSPRERMQAKLSELEEKTNKNYFLIFLAKAGSQLSKTNTVQLKSMDFRDDVLTLELTANTFNDLDNLTRALMSQGLKVKQQGAAEAGQQVKASLLIERGVS